MKDIEKVESVEDQEVVEKKLNVGSLIITLMIISACIKYLILTGVIWKIVLGVAIIIGMIADKNRLYK